MALKDWKRVKGNLGSAVYYKKGSRLIRVVELFSNNWKVEVGKFSRTFKTKSTALAYARKYMRSH